MIELIALACFAIAIIAMVAAPAAGTTVVRTEPVAETVPSRAVTQTA